MIDEDLDNKKHKGVNSNVFAAVTVTDILTKIPHGDLDYDTELKPVHIYVLQIKELDRIV